MHESKDPTIKHRVLALDGGGAKGMYSLGFLSRLEKDLDKPLNQYFDLIYGTSTGAIIATLVSLGTPVEEIYQLYLKHIPAVLTPFWARTRSIHLRAAATCLLADRSWVDLKVPTGIVATNWNSKEPLVFKNYSGMAHRGEKAFIPGYGATLADAICASGSAVPLFKPVPITLVTRGGTVVEAYDGGFCANNPALFALVDLDPLGFDPKATVLFTVGVGHYPEPTHQTYQRRLLKAANWLQHVKLLTGVLEVSSNTNGILQKLLLKEVRYIRADQSFNTPDMGTDLLEADISKLKLLYGRGTQTYEDNETTIHSYL